MAGYGMNAGIADAIGLSWVLAGCLNGWATEAALAAYEAERQPITEQVGMFAMNHAISLQKEREGVPANIEEPGEKGALARENAGKSLYELNVRQYCAGGLNFGYFYDKSPLVAYDGEAAPLYTINTFEQSTVPGCRTPHIWLDGQRSLYDMLGPEYTLLRFDRSIDVEPLASAARKYGVPLTILDLPKSAEGVYRHALVLSRPDRHVAWRGDELPAEPECLINRIRGASAEEPIPPLTFPEIAIRGNRLS